MNSLTASVCFDFQGKSYNIDSEIQIDAIINHQDFYNSIYLALAKIGEIGLYTYEFEIMMDQDIIFSNASGCVVGCIENGKLNLNLLRKNHQLIKINPQIEKLIDEYKKNNDLKQALIQAYMLGININSN